MGHALFHPPRIPALLHGRLTGEQVDAVVAALEVRGRDEGILPGLVPLVAEDEPLDGQVPSEEARRDIVMAPDYDHSPIKRIHDGEDELRRRLQEDSDIDAFDRWYEAEHLPDAKNAFDALSVRRGCGYVRSDAR